MPLKYLELSEQYRPPQITTLLIGEAPPPGGTKYFYLPQAMSNNTSIEQDRSLPATIFHHYFLQRPKSQEEYTALLAGLKDAGIFLVDILDEPLKIRDNKENEARLVAEIPNLRSKLQKRGITVAENKIVFLLARNSYRAALRRHFSSAALIPWIEFRMNPEPLPLRKEIAQ